MAGRPLFKRAGGQLVEAEQLTVHVQPEGVEMNRVGITDRICYTFRTPFGLVVLPLGTWIVFDQEGARPVVQKTFETLYTPLTIAGRAVAAGERAMRKVWRPAGS